MEEPNRQLEWHAFLASRLEGLEDLRTRIWERGQRSGCPIWVSEIAAEDELKDRTLDDVQVACLRRVRTAPKFICLLDGSFGTTWNEGQVSILELELATAAFSRRDIWIFRIAPFDAPDPRIESLLAAIKRCCPAARFTGPMSQDAVLESVAHLLEPLGKTQQTLRVGSLVQRLARARSPALSFNLSFRDVQFLDGEFAPLLHEAPDIDRVRSLLRQAAEEKVIPDKLAKTWIAIRHLSAAPFSDNRHEEFLPLWETALGQWSSAAAWYSLHGHFYLGRLASVNSLTVIRTRMPLRMQSEIGPPSIFANAGAAASEYYSIAKLVPSRWQRYLLLRKALWNCNAALRDRGTADPVGLLDIRGHVKLSLLNPLGALSDLSRALALRREAGGSADRIGESEVHLGRALAYCRQFSKAERLLEDGVAKLLTTENYPFIAQGLRHLAAFYALVGRRDDAISTLRKAEAVANQSEIQGQLQQIQDELRKLGESPLH